MTSKPLIVMALPQEAQAAFDGLPVTFCGVGKVNATHHLTKSLLTERPTHVVNLGTAGSSVHPASSIVNCTAFVQRDMDASALGFARYTTPFDTASQPVLRYGTRHSMFAEAICGSGDNFHTDGHCPDYDVVDMEAYALSHICQREEVRFSCLKYITDGADGSAANDWQTMLTQAAKALRIAYDSIAT